MSSPATLRAKSMAGDSRAYLWVILDHDGKMDAVCHSAKSVSELLGKNALALALTKSKAAFVSKGQTPSLTGKLVDPKTGTAF